MTDRYFSIVFDMTKLSDDEQRAVIAEASSAFRSQKAVCAGWESDVNDGWISVDDMLPKEFETVLLFGKKYNGEPLITNGHLVQSLVDEFGVGEGFSAPIFITHWQPLPKPPKE